MTLLCTAWILNTLLCSTFLCQGCLSLLFYLFGCPSVASGFQVTAAPGQVAGEKKGKVIPVCGGRPLCAAATRRHTTLHPSAPHSRSLATVPGTLIWIAHCWDRSQETKTWGPLTSCLINQSMPEGSVLSRKFVRNPYAILCCIICSRTSKTLGYIQK